MVCVADDLDFFVLPPGLLALYLSQSIPLRCVGEKLLHWFQELSSGTARQPVVVIPRSMPRKIELLSHRASQALAHLARLMYTLRVDRRDP